MINCTVSDLIWFVAHTRPRCEKKLVEHCEREGLSSTLPCYPVVHKYRGKVVKFQKPLFPGYVFLKIAPELRDKAYQSDYVANLLNVPDQKLFIYQLDQILRALEAGMELKVVPSIEKGSQVRIKSGPLQGMEGWVEDRLGMSVVMLRLDFIGQAAAVKLDVEILELI